MPTQRNEYQEFQRQLTGFDTGYLGPMRPGAARQDGAAAPAEPRRSDYLVSALLTALLILAGYLLATGGVRAVAGLALVVAGLAMLGLVGAAVVQLRRQR